MGFLCNFVKGMGTRIKGGPLPLAWKKNWGLKNFNIGIFQRRILGRVEPYGGRSSFIDSHCIVSLRRWRNIAARISRFWARGPQTYVHLAFFDKCAQWAYRALILQRRYFVISKARNASLSVLIALPGSFSIIQKLRCIELLFGWYLWLNSNCLPTISAPLRSCCSTLVCRPTALYPGRRSRTQHTIWGTTIDVPRGHCLNGYRRSVSRFWYGDERFKGLLNFVPPGVTCL